MGVCGIVLIFLRFSGDPWGPYPASGVKSGVLALPNILPVLDPGVNSESPRPPDAMEPVDLLGRVGVCGKANLGAGDGEGERRCGLEKRAARGEMLAAATRGRIEGRVAGGGGFADDDGEGSAVEELEVDAEFEVLALVRSLGTVAPSFFRLARSCAALDFLLASRLSSCLRSSASFRAF